MGDVLQNRKQEQYTSLCHMALTSPTTTRRWGKLPAALRASAMAAHLPALSLQVSREGALPVQAPA